jgi:hypothetical protein
MTATSERSHTHILLGTAVGNRKATAIHATLCEFLPELEWTTDQIGEGEEGEFSTFLIPRTIRSWNEARTMFAVASRMWDTLNP